MGLWRGVVLGFILALVLAAAGAYIYFGFGLAPVATASQPMPLEKLLANRALRAAIGKAADRPAPLEPSEPNLKSGAIVYRDNCAVCHGQPGQDITNIAKGMFPKPPQLLRGKGVTDDPVGETFWKVQNGIRLTGMPGFRASLTEDQIWQVSQLLAHADKLPDSVRGELNRKD
jgi:mono/diheme cytochrome c family protein